MQIQLSKTAKLLTELNHEQIIKLSISFIFNLLEELEFECFIQAANR